LEAVGILGRPPLRTPPVEEKYSNVIEDPDQADAQEKTGKEDQSPAEDRQGSARADHSVDDVQQMVHCYIPRAI
jgi:hypothetical protein